MRPKDVVGTIIRSYRDRGKGDIPIAFLSDSRGWGDAQVGRYVKKHFPATRGYAFHNWQSGFPPPVWPGIVHFQNRYSLLENRWPKSLSLYGSSVVTWFHGDPGNRQSQFGKLGEKLEPYLPQIHCVMTACQLTAERLARWGVPAHQLRVVPLGVDLDLFKPPTASERNRARRRLEIPEDALCIASFQKDGVGWDSGIEPKFVKGPDVLIEVVKRLARNYQIFVLLCGPARGYVIRGLKQLNIDYHHALITHHHDLPVYYHAADCYLIPSREEGGPLSLLESLAANVPVVSTKVGMAPDVIRHGENGFLADVEDVEGLANLIARLADGPGLREQCATKGSETALNYGWERIAHALIDDVYAECMR